MKRGSDLWIHPLRDPCAHGGLGQRFLRRFFNVILAFLKHIRFVRIFACGGFDFGGRVLADDERTDDFAVSLIADGNDGCFTDARVEGETVLDLDGEEVLQMGGCKWRFRKLLSCR